MSKKQDIHQAFEDFLAEQDSRYTQQKREIVDALKNMMHPFEVDDFLAILHRKKKDKNFSRATVYRTIKQLLEAKLIQKIQTPEGKVYYETNFEQEQHDHIICNACGKIIQIQESIINQYFSDYCQQIDFVPDYRSVHIYGTCKKYLQSGELCKD